MPLASSQLRAQVSTRKGWPRMYRMRRARSRPLACLEEVRLAFRYKPVREVAKKNSGAPLQHKVLLGVGAYDDKVPTLERGPTLC